MVAALADVTATAQAYGDEREAAGVASQQGTIDALHAELAADSAQVAQLSGQVALDASQIAELRAQVDALTPAKVTEFVDFAQQSSGMWLGAKGLVDSGSAKNIRQMKASTSTKAAAVSALVKPATNPYRLMRVGGNSATTVAAGTKVGGFTLQGTEQGHAYGGLTTQYATGASLADVAVRGIPGFASGPPGETFARAQFRSNGFTDTDLTLDGRDASGTPVSATLYGANYCTGGTITRLKANYAAAGFGMALFQCRGITVTDSDLRFNRKAVNIEQAAGGSIRFVRCDFTGTKAAYIAQISSRDTTTQVTFEDCTFDGDLCVVNAYGTSALGGHNRQLDSDIRRIDAGVDVTSDPAKFRIVHNQ